jgi:hypothetical protein
MNTFPGLQTSSCIFNWDYLGRAITNGRKRRSCWAKFSTLSQAVLLITPKSCSLQMATSKVESLAPVS